MTNRRYKIYEKIQKYSCWSAILIFIISNAVMVILMDHDFDMATGRLVYYLYIISMGVTGLLLLLLFVFIHLESPQQKRALNEVKRYIDTNPNISLRKVKFQTKKIMTKYNITISDEEVIKYYNRNLEIRSMIAIEKKQAEEQRKKEELRKKIEESSRHIPAKIRREVWKRDNGRCVLCGDQKRLEFDHIIPFSKGGAHSVKNIRLLCQKCNRIRSDKIGD